MIRRIDPPGRVLESIERMEPTQIIAVYVYQDQDGREAACTVWSTMSSERMTWLVHLLSRDLREQIDAEKPA